MLFNSNWPFSRDTLSQQKNYKMWKNYILLPKLFWPLKFEAEGREFAKFLRPLEQFIQTVKGQNRFW